MHEFDLDVAEKDEEFTNTARKFLMNLTKTGEILPLTKTLCLDEEDIVGAGSTADGENPGYGSLGYIISENRVTKKRSSVIAVSNLEISKL